jgi:hypothetical protein
MNSNDKQRFALLMYGMADNFRDTLTEAGLKFRFQALSGYSYKQLEHAAIHIIRTRKFTKMPTIADFIEAIDGSGDDIAETQAHHVLCQVRELGAYQTPTFDDPVTRELASRRWTWGTLCSMLERDHQWFVKEFVQAYRAYERLEIVPQLEGPTTFKQLAGGMFEDVAGPS